MRAITLDSDGNLYALNSAGGPTGYGSITVYSSGSSGDAAPIQTITSSFTGINSSSGIAMDSAGKIYVTNGFGGSGFPGGSLAIFPAGSYATAAPASVIAGANTGLDFPQKVALDATGNISVLNLNNVLTVYPVGSAGNVTPNETINIRGGNLGPSGIARGIGGELYVANQGAVKCNNGPCHQTSMGSVDIYPAHAKGDASPSAVISGYAAGIASPSAIAVSKRNNIFVANMGPLDCQCGCFPIDAGSITVYVSGSEAGAKPIATIQGPRTRLEIPEAIAVDSTENIYVVNAAGFEGFFCEAAGSAIEQVPGLFEFGEFGGSSSILIFKAGSDGDTPPIGTIGGPFTALGGSAIAIGPSGP